MNPLNNYRVTCKQTITAVYEIEAQSPEAAENMASDRALEGSHDGLQEVSTAGRQFNTQLVGPGLRTRLQMRTAALERVLSGLLGCCELNLSSIEDHTRDCIVAAHSELQRPV